MPPGLLIEKPVSRLRFGRVLFNPAKEGKWIFAHSVDPPSNSRLSHEVPMDEESLEAICRFDAANRLAPAGSGPYSDSSGMVGGLSRHLASMIRTEDELIVRMIAMVRGREMFSFDRSLVLSDNAFTASSLLSDPARLGPSGTIRFVHEMEPYLLSVCLLRGNGMHAYPALAISGPDGATEEAEPLVAVISPSSEVPLKTFSLTGVHPPMRELELMGDVAAMGLAHSMRAENLSKRLAEAMFSHAVRGSIYPEEAIDASIQEISGSLFLSHRLWPGSVFIRRALDRLGEGVGQKLSLAALRVFAGTRMMEFMEAWAESLAEGLRMRAEECLEGMKRSCSRQN